MQSSKMVWWFWEVNDIDHGGGWRRSGTKDVPIGALPVHHTWSTTFIILRPGAGVFINRPAGDVYYILFPDTGDPNAST